MLISSHVLLSYILKPSSTLSKCFPPQTMYFYLWQELFNNLFLSWFPRICSFKWLFFVDLFNVFNNMNCFIYFENQFIMRLIVFDVNMLIILWLFIFFLSWHLKYHLLNKMSSILLYISYFLFFAELFTSVLSITIWSAAVSSCRILLLFISLSSLSKTAETNKRNLYTYKWKRIFKTVNTSV